jgi:hypothetical protein
MAGEDKPEDESPPARSGGNTPATGHDDALCIPFLPKGQDASLHANFSFKADFLLMCALHCVLNSLEIVRRLARSVSNQLYRTFPC